MIKNLSPSRASQFKTCPKQFKFANVDKILVDSPIGKTNRTDIESKISELENQKNEIQTEIEKLLREQSSS